jgi:hypothetical protein
VIRNLYSAFTISSTPTSTPNLKKHPLDIFNKNLIEDPTKQIPGFQLPRKIWCKLNRFRTGHGKCNNMLFHWNIRENPSCECGAEKETIQHIVEECPLTKFQQGFSKLHLLTEDALNWLQQIKTYNLP